VEILGPYFVVMSEARVSSLDCVRETRRRL
jgi:hypothetical protein